MEAECKIKEVRLNVRKLKKLKSRSNSESSSISVHSNRSSEEDISTRIKRRPPRTTRLPKIVLDSELEPEPSKKDSRKLHSKKKKLTSISYKAKISNSNVPKYVNTAVVRSKVVNKILFGNDIQIDMPEELRNLLVDDYDLISRQRKTLIVPSRITVTDLVTSFNEDSRKTCGGRARSSKVSGVEDVAQGLIQYFDASLGTQLLYKFERVQYSDVLKEHPAVPMSRLYGPIHLLRLLTKLGPMLTSAGLIPPALSSLHTALAALVQYMHSRRTDLFRREDYGTASPEYHRRAL